MCDGLPPSLAWAGIMHGITCTYVHLHVFMGLGLEEGGQSGYRSARVWLRVSGCRHGHSDHSLQAARSAQGHQEADNS